MSTRRQRSLIESLSFSVRLRLAHLEEVVYWTGKVSRRDLQTRFSISSSKAALDFATYLKIAPANIAYDRRAKRYLANSKFAPVFYEPDVSNAISSWATTEKVPSFDRPLKPTLLRCLVQAIRDRVRCRVYYHSMRSHSVTWRVVSPHAFAHDGERWHLRIFDHTTQKWCDLVLGRIGKAIMQKTPACDPGKDADWHMIDELSFRPADTLHAEQRTALLQDYGARGGVIRLRVRRAMAFYIAARLGLLSNTPVRFTPEPPTADLIRDLQAAE